MTTTNEKPTALKNRLLSLTLTAAAAVLSVVWRVIPHIPNTTPVGALGLFAGARLRWWQAALLLVAVMVVSDVVLLQLFGKPPFDLLVYGSLLLNVLIGAWLSRYGTLWCAGAGSVLGSVQFYLVTNFGAWLALPEYYSRTPAGLLDCYVKGLPFYGPTMAGDVCFAALLFGSYVLLTNVLAEKEEPVSV